MNGAKSKHGLSAGLSHRTRGKKGKETGPGIKRKQFVGHRGDTSGEEGGENGGGGGQK